MKKVMIFIMAISMLSACSRRSDTESKLIMKPDSVTNVIEYKDAAGYDNIVTEFVTTTGKDCTIVQTHYEYDKSKSSLSCKSKKEGYNFVQENLGKVQAQYGFKIKDNVAQITEFSTKTGKDCTVIQTNYGYDKVNSSVSCS